MDLLILAVLVIIPPAIYELTPQILQSAGVKTLLTARNLPGRDALAFFLLPSRRGDYGAYEFAHAALTQVEPNAVIAGDHTPLTPLIFVQQTELLRPDISIAYLPTHGQIDVLQEFACTHPVYLTDTQNYYEMDRISQVFVVERRGVLYKLFPRRDAALQ